MIAGHDEPSRLEIGEGLGGGPDRPRRLGYAASGGKVEMRAISAHEVTSRAPAPSALCFLIRIRYCIRIGEYGISYTAGYLCCQQKRLVTLTEVGYARLTLNQRASGIDVEVNQTPVSFLPVLGASGNVSSLARVLDGRRRLSPALDLAHCRLEGAQPVSSSLQPSAAAQQGTAASL
jgi:hypothetical protein